MGLNIGGEVEKINGKDLRYHQFVERFLEKNQPVLLTGLMDGWSASKDWVTPNGDPNLSFFSAHFGKSRVQVLSYSTHQKKNRVKKEDGFFFIILCLQFCHCTIFLMVSEDVSNF